MHHKTWKRKKKTKSDTTFFGSKFFIFAFSSRFWESFIVSWYSSRRKKVPRSFFHYGARKKLPCELIFNFFILGLYLNSGTGLWLIFLVKVLMMVTLCLSIYSHWFYPKEMEIIGIFAYMHAFYQTRFLTRTLFKEHSHLHTKVMIFNRFGYFVFEQPGVLDYSDEGGPTDSCSPNMSNGRGPFKSTKNFQKKYGLTLTAATFLIIDYNEASMQIACEWQKCIGDTINLVSPLKCGNEEK